MQSQSRSTIQVDAKGAYMANVILAETQTVSEPFSKETHKEELLVCHVYGGEAIVIEVRDTESYPNWIPLRINGEAAQFEAAGDSFILTMSIGYENRLRTGTAGSVITKYGV